MAQWHGFPVPWAASQSRKAGSIITYAALITACGKCEEWRQVPSLWLVSSSKKSIFWKKVVDVISQKWECLEWTNQNGYLSKFLATSQQPLASVWEFLSEPSVWCEHIFSEPLTSPASTLMDSMDPLGWGRDPPRPMLMVLPFEICFSWLPPRIGRFVSSEIINVDLNYWRFQSCKYGIIKNM